MMKTRIIRFSKRSLSTVLAILMMISTLMVGTISAKAASISNGKVLYLLNSGNWSGCQLYFWGSGWNNYVTFSKISGTNIYANNFSGGYGYDGCKFRSDDSWTNQSSGNITASFSSHTWFDGSSTSGSTTITNMNGKVKVVSKVSTNGTSYSTAANSDCVATINSKKVTSGSTSTTDTTGTTGSSSEVSIDSAYGATVNLSGTSGTNYEFLGFSTTDSSSLPASLNSTASYTNETYKGNTNSTVYYAYFKPKTYTVTLDKNASDATAGTASVTATYGLAMPSATMPTRDGYNFAGYYDTSATSGGTQYYTAAGASARTWNKSSNTTLYARWTRKTYTVTYNKGTASGATGDQQTDTKTHGTALTLKGAIFTRTGYTQKGWSTAQAGTTKTYDLSASYTDEAAITLYPYWEINTYAITLSESVTTGGVLKVDGNIDDGTAVTHGSHTFRVDAPSGYEISSISGLGATWTNNDSYAVSNSVEITAAATITVTYVRSSNPALRVDYTGASGATYAVTGTVTTTNQTDVTVSFTNQSAFDNSTDYSVSYTKDGGASTVIKSGETSSSGGIITAKEAGTLTAGTYVYTITVGGTKTSTVTVQVLSAYKLTVRAANSNSTMSTDVADSCYTNVFSNAATAITGAGTYYCKPSTAYYVKYTISDSARYTFNSTQTTSTVESTRSGSVSADTTVTAPTVYNRQYAITVPSNAAYTISGITTGNYDYDSSITFTVTANKGYQIDSVSGTGVTSNSGNSYTINVTGATSISVTTSLITPTIKVITRKNPSGVSPASAEGWTSTYIDGDESTIEVQTNYSDYPSGATVQFVKNSNDSAHGTFNSNSITVNRDNIDSLYYYAVKVTVNGQSVKSGRVYIYKYETVQISLPSVEHGTVTASYTNAYNQTATLTEGNTAYAKKNTDVIVTVTDCDTDYEFKYVSNDGGTTKNTNNPATYSSVSSDTTFTVSIDKINYVYFYASLPTNWGEYDIPYIKIGTSTSNAITVDYIKDLGEKTLYSGINNTTAFQSGYNDNITTKHNVRLYKVNVDSVSSGAKLYIYNSSSYSWCIPNGIAFNTNADGYIYMGYTKTNDNTNAYKSYDPQTVSISSLSGSTAVGTYNSLNIYNSTSSITVNVPRTTFYRNGGTSTQQTAGGDSVKLTYEVYKDNGSSDDTLVYSISNQDFATAKSISFADVKNGTGFVNGGEYYIKVTTVDNTSGKVKQVSGESTHFYIEDQFNVTVSGTKTDDTAIAKATPMFTVAGTSRANNYTFPAGTLNTVHVVAADLTSSGYQFENWVTTGGVSVTTTTNRTTTASADAAGTLTAKYSLINYNAGVGSNSSNANNTVYVNSDGTVSVQLTVEDTLTAIATAYAAGGYELDHIELRNAAGTAVISGYENFTTGPMPAQDVTVYAVFKASTPSIDKINNTTISNNAYSVSNIYAGQSVTFTPHSSSYGVITFSEGGTDSSYVTESNGVYTFTVPEYIGAAYNTTKAYTFTITPTNTPEAGIDPQDGQAVTITVNAKYSAVQQAYIRLYTQYTTYKNYGITEADTEEGYTAYSDALEVARTAVADKISDSTYVIPWDSSDTSPTYTVKRTNLTTAFNNIKFKKNTIYALVNYNENIKIFSYGTRKGWFTAKNTTNRVGSSTTNFNMTYEGTTNNGKYLYSYTYYGKSKFVVYQADGTTYCTTSNYGSYKLSGIIDLSTADYSEYYTDLKSNTVGSGTTTTKSSFADFAMTDYTANSETLENDLLEKGTTYSIDNIIGSEKLNISYTGSLKGSGQTVNTSITVTGPMGRSDVTSEEVTLDSSHTWTPDESGKYTLELTAYIGTDGRADEGTPTFVLPTKQYTLYVAYDEIAVYADMNGNVGTPILSFNYSYLDDNNNTVTGTLPYEFDLVTGSESVYSVVLSLPVLQTYGYNDILTNGIEIDNLYIDTDQYNGFIIQKQALRTGTVWLKANSTHMTGFDQIAYGSANRSFKAVFRDSSNNDTLVTNSFAVASGSGVITDELLDNGTETTEDDYYRYNVFYAAYDSVADRNFSYNVKVVAENDISHNSVNYYFDHWEVAGQTNTTADVANGTDINLNAMPRYSDGDITYVAVYKPVDTSARAEITYKFEDFDTDDGNYVYDPDKTTKDETYVKTVKVDSAVSASNAGSVASTNAPIIKSNYFDYTFSSATYKSYDSATNKYKVEATFTKTPHSYKIKVVHSNGSTETVETGYYQQPLELKASDYGISSGKYHWSIYEGSTERVLATDTSYTARFVTSNDVNTSIQTIYLKSSTASAASTANSAIMYSYSSVDYESSTPTAIHNFYIIDAMTPSNGTLVGGGVVYATATTGSAVNQGYRQANAQTVLGDNGEDDDGKSISEKIQDYIGGILNTEAKYSLEYKPQSINNIGFRYLPYENGKDVFRYSDAIGAYIYTFAGTNTNSESLNGQDLRVFSYFIYKDTSNNYHTVVSGMYAQVSRYINTASGS